MANLTYARFTREEQAEMEVGTTSVSRSLCFVLVFGFLATAVSVPVIQHVIEVRAGFAEKGRWVWPKAYETWSFPGEAIRAFRDPAHEALWGRFQAANTEFMQKVKAFEKALEDDSFLARASIPRTQALAAKFLGLGNEQVYLGRGGWLFYQPEVSYLADAGFLDPSILKARGRAGHTGEEIQPDPVKAVVAFRDELKARGIHLLLVPAPVKPMIEPEHLSPRYGARLPIPLQNSSYSAFLRALDQAGVDYLDVSGALANDKRQTGRPQFLLTDTHWTPEAMDRAAQLLAEKIAALGLLEAADAAWSRTSETVSGNGDITAMLKLPATSTLYPPQTVTIHPVKKSDGSPWTADRAASLLLLGDSFSNIYSLAAMGWGATAGFAEQVSYHLKAPLDAILRNDAGAYATRDILARELSQGRDRLAGKKIVVWEFAMRELAVGDWKMIALPAAKTPASDTPAGKFFVPPDGEIVRVTGIIQSASPFPRPGEVPYADHIFSLSLTKVAGPNVPDGSRALVYLWSMKANVLTPASAWKPGDRVTLELRPWNDVAAEYERFNRSEPEDSDLQLETPAWGEPIKNP